MMPQAQDDSGAFSFACQRCRQPLKLDSSLSDLSQASFDMLASSHPERPVPSTSPTPAQVARLPPSVAAALSHHRNRSSPESPSKVSQPISNSKSERNTKPRPSSSSGAKTTPASAESFVMLGDSTIVPAKQQQQQEKQQQLSSASSQAKGLPSKHSKSTTSIPSMMPESGKSRLFSLFNLLNSHGDVDHPLCTDCADTLRDIMTSRMEEIKAEKETYLLFEKDLAKQKHDAPNKTELQNEIDQLKTEKDKAIEEIYAVEAERNRIAKEMEQLDIEEKELEAEEMKFWDEYNSYQAQVKLLNDAARSLLTQYKHDARELEKLEKTNVLNDVFCIGHDGGLATINGLRFGRLPTVPVDWPEINAAWGHTVFLLQTLARKLDYEFKDYRLVPMASFSRIEKVGGDKAVMELYGSGDFAFGRLFQNRRFDFAMVAFLDCLSQLMDYAEKLSLENARENPSSNGDNIPGRGSDRLRLPHRVQKDKIGNVSIKLQFASDVTWTRALRHVLLNMKMLLLFVSAHVK